MSETDEKAWADFWAAQSARSGGGCLPDVWREIETAQREAWRGFSAALPTPANILDLATGDGRVMAWLREEGDGITATGVDLAPDLPAPPAGTAVLAGVAMEELPFHAHSFDAVTSQFGFEYGNVERAAAEISRVLKPGGQVGLMTHRSDGPILAHNQERRMQIGWLFERKNLFALAHRLLTLRGGAFASTPVAIMQVAKEGAQRFGPQSVAWEIAEAVRRALMMPAHVPASHISETLNAMESQAHNEIGRIGSLERACRTAADQERLAAAFGAAGLESIEKVPVLGGFSERPFADFRRLKRTN